MKKSDEDIKLSITDSSFTKDVFLDEIKTTNVNILLNRVRIEKKNNFKKKILLFIFNAYSNFCYFYCNNLKLNISKIKTYYHKSFPHYSG